MSHTQLSIMGDVVDTSCSSLAQCVSPQTYFHTFPFSIYVSVLGRQKSAVILFSTGVIEVEKERSGGP